MGYSPFWFNQQSSGSSRQTITNYTNGTISTLAKGTLVGIDASSNLALIDVTSEVSVKSIVGVTNIAIPVSASGGITDNGRLENITTSFSVRDVLYIDTTGALTNIAPSVGINGFVSGDFVILVGVIVKNEFNPSLLDLKLMISVIGQL